MVRGMSVGDPDDPTTEIGPLVAERQQERVDKYIALGQEEGARVVVGGNGRPDGISKGWYVQPTVFADVTNDMRIAQEEIFGPVLAVIPFDDVDDAVRIANDSEFGLAGSVWTGDPTGVGMDVARRVRTGTFGVNQYTMDFVAPVRRLQGLRHRPGVRQGRPRALPRAEVDHPAVLSPCLGVVPSARRRGTRPRAPGRSPRVSRSPSRGRAA